MTSIDGTVLLRPGLDPRLRLLALLLLAVLSVTYAATWLLTQSPVSCERHKGDFGNGFAARDFDINSVDCRISSAKNSPKVRFWGVAPYVGIERDNSLFR